ncbi:hypothetical protein [Bacillus mycoides]|uniref:hypothetical protein n=2 Tax=Bacillus mycoides TaxID=1405 RepID=UPI0015CFB0F3|nr:hypothetical protein [Bacillus mycoides]
MSLYRDYFNSDGAMKTGSVSIDGKTYSFYKNGTLVPKGIKGWVKEDTEWYYLNDDGTMKTGWLDYGIKHISSVDLEQ